MREWNFADVWDTIASAHGDHVVVRQGDREVRWDELEAGAASVAGTLVGEGLGHQAKVAQYLYNCPEYVESFYAAYKAGLVPVNTNYRYLEDELVYLWDNADVEAVVFHGTFAERIEAVRDRVPRVRLWLWVDDGTAPCPAWAVPYEKARAGGVALPPGRRPDGDDVMLMYTGGTTGLPKGVMWRQADYFASFNEGLFRGLLPSAPDLDAVVPAIEGRGRTAVCAPPLMHGTGLSVLHVTLLTSGCMVLLPSRSFDAEETLDEVVRHRAYSLMIAGDVFGRPLVEALDANPGRWDLSGLREIGSAGMMWSEPTRRALLAHAPHLRLTDRLGSTEVPLVAKSRSSADGVEATAGFFVDDDVVVLDDDLRPVEPGSGAVGRLAKAGPLPLGYYKDPEKSAQTWPEIGGRRYGITGDYAMVEEDGRVRLLGRGSVCINTGAEKVFPEEVEEALKQHPAVGDAIVVGVPDARFGERVVAVVSPRRGASVDEDDVVAFVKQRLAGYKAPRSLLVVDQTLRGPNGKADYRATRELAVQRLGAAG